MFQPKLKNNEYIRLPWQLLIGSFLGIWPLRDSATKRIFISYYGYALFFLSMYYIHIEAELRFLIYNISNILLLTDVLMSNLIGLQLFISVSSKIWNRKKLKKLLEDFYESIYIDQTENFDFHGFISNSLFPMNVSNYAAIFCVVLFGVEPITIFLFFNDGKHDPRPLPFRQEYLFSLENLFIYGIVLVLNEWIDFLGGFSFISDSYLIGMTVTHSTARFKELNKNIKNLFTDIEKDLNSNNVIAIQKCNATLNGYLRQHCKLRKFVDEIQDNFELIIFITISFDTIMMCVGAFQFASSNGAFGISFLKSSAYVAAIIIQILILGNMGSNLVEESQKTKTAFYFCGWEELLCYSQSNNREFHQEKLKFTKSLSIAFVCTQESHHLRGYFSTFYLSIQTAIEVIRKGVSFFMVLNALDAY